jgi:transcriptional regulator of arginine metabolism
MQNRGAAHDHHAREQRHRQILALLRRSRVVSQQELAERLSERGIQTTQSSLSRDLRELGVRKLAGRYVPPRPPAAGAPGRNGEAAELARLVREVRIAGPHLLVVTTPSGAAQTVGIALDRSGWPELVGTVAGDDTVFVATNSPRDQQRLRERIAAAIADAGGPLDAASF